MSRQGWEDAEFPIVCETCLGSNQYIRMLRQGFGKECKICSRPYTVFKWSPGESGVRWKRTEICQTCAKIKNVCQSCVLDLDYALPSKIRDAVLESHSGMPSTDVNTQVFVRKMEEQMGDSQALVNHGKAESAAKEVLRKLARSAGEPYSVNQRKSKSSSDGSNAPLCVFFLRGTCKRGDTCPMRHERPTHWDDKQKQLHQAPAKSGAALVAAKTTIAGPAWTGAYSLPEPKQSDPSQQQLSSQDAKNPSKSAGNARKGAGTSGGPRAPPQSHAEAHRRDEQSESASESATNHTKDPAAAMMMIPPPPGAVLPPVAPGQKAHVLYPSQDPSILGTNTRSFRA